MRKLKSKKGLTLLEILISLAIFSIMIVPIGSMLRMSIKSNKSNDIKQEATLLGQEIIEELKFINDISKTKFSLTNINFSSNQGNTNKKLNYYTDNYGDNKFNIELLIKQNEDIEYDYDYEYKDIDKHMNSNIVLESNSNTIYIKDAINDKFIASFNTMSSEKFKIEVVDGNGNIKLIFNDNSDLSIGVLNNTELENIKLMINLNENYKIEDLLEIDFYNTTGKPLELYIKKSYSATGDISVENKFGKLTIYNNIRDIEEVEEEKIDNLYNIEINIKDSKDNEILFNGNLNRNLSISS